MGAAADAAATEALAELDAVLIGGGPMPAGLGEKATAAGISWATTAWEDGSRAVRAAGSRASA